MPKATYRVQLRRYEDVQVDIESDTPLTIEQVQERATAQANREFGQMDEAEIIEFSVTITVNSGAQDVTQR